MRSESIDSARVPAIEWDEGYFKHCNFAGFAIEGQMVASDFVGCIFKSIDWYWGLFTGCNFINCEILDCEFAGTAFPDTRFVDCKFVNCHFRQDNLGQDCDLSKTTLYGCTVESCSGLNLR
jgi:uncharacterized protein YjbI with pentapeptide repeats